MREQSRISPRAISPNKISYMRTNFEEILDHVIIKVLMNYKFGNKRVSVWKLYKFCFIIGDIARVSSHKMGKIKKKIVIPFPR